MNGDPHRQTTAVPKPVTTPDGGTLAPYAVAMYGDLSWVVPLHEVADDDGLHDSHTLLWRQTA